MSPFEGENMETQDKVIGLTYIFMTLSLQQKLIKMCTAIEILTMQ